MKYLLLSMLAVTPLSADVKKDVKELKQHAEFVDEALGGMAHHMFYMQAQLDEQARLIQELQGESNADSDDS
jgi:hypothetical protein